MLSRPRYRIVGRRWSATRVFISAFLAGWALINAASAADTRAAAAPVTPAPDSWLDNPSIHLALGGQDYVGGGTHALGQHTSGWQAMYEQPRVLGGFGVALKYLNDGYLGSTDVPWQVRLKQPLNYRDSYAVQLDYWSPLWARCRIGIAAGPEFYFDTVTTTYRALYEDRHGFGLQTSLSGQCRISSHWAFEALASRSFDIANFDATTLLLGLAYTPSIVTSSSDGQSVAKSKYVEVTAGRTQIDSFDMSDEFGGAVWLTYGQALNGAFALAGSMLNESVSGLIQRRALAAQLIVYHEFAAGRLQLFAGAGPDLARTRNEDVGDIRTQLNVLFAYGMKVSIWQQLALVMKFGRVESASNKFDADLLTIGIGINIPAAN